jgi:hypothetical protein
VTNTRHDVEVIPITLNQERQLLFEEAAAAAGIAAAPLHLALAFEIESLQLPLLTQALQMVVQRQGALRASFVATGDRRAAAIAKLLNNAVIDPGSYQQRVHSTAILPLEIKRLGPDDGESAVADLVQQSIGRPFDCTRPPLARAIVIERGDGLSLLVVELHHVIGDRESLRVFHRDLEGCYAGLVRQEAQSCVEQQRAYGQALAQLKDAYTRDGEASINHWDLQWKAYEPFQIQPSDICLVPLAGKAPSDEPDRFILDEAGLRQLRALARASNLTPTMIYLAAMSILLARCTRRDSVPIWINIDNRWRIDVEGVMAWLVHSHLLGISVDSSGSGLQLLDGVRRVVLEAVKHGHVPLSELWRRTGRSLERGVRFQFNLIAEGHPALERLGHTIRRVPVPGRRYEARGIELFATERQGIVAFDAGYSEKYFSATEVHHILASYLRILERLIADPSAAVSTL